MQLTLLQLLLLQLSRCISVATTQLSSFTLFFFLSYLRQFYSSPIWYWYIIFQSSLNVWTINNYNKSRSSFYLSKSPLYISINLLSTSVISFRTMWFTFCKCDFLYTSVIYFMLELFTFLKCDLISAKCDLLFTSVIYVLQSVINFP